MPAKDSFAEDGHAFMGPNGVETSGTGQGANRYGESEEVAQESTQPDVGQITAAQYTVS